MFTKSSFKNKTKNVELKNKILFTLLILFIVQILSNIPTFGINREVLKTLGGKKVVLNQSLLTPKDIAEFEMEAGIKTFYSIHLNKDFYPLSY